MPEYCPHCGELVVAHRKENDRGRFYEVWECEDCDEEWRHPEETILNRDLDFSKNKDQVSRRNEDTDLNW